MYDNFYLKKNNNKRSTDSPSRQNKRIDRLMMIDIQTEMFTALIKNVSTFLIHVVIVQCASILTKTQPKKKILIRQYPGLGHDILFCNYQCFCCLHTVHETK